MGNILNSINKQQNIRIIIFSKKIKVHQLHVSNDYNTAWLNKMHFLGTIFKQLKKFKKLYFFFL